MGKDQVWFNRNRDTIYFRHIHDALTELASEEMQKLLWLADGTSGYVSSLEEASASLFDDSGLADSLEHNSPRINPKAVPLLRQLSKELNAIDNNYNGLSIEELIEDERMSSVRRLAAELLIIGVENPDKSANDFPG